MTDSALLTGVTQRVVDVFTHGGFLFTALDVSNSVKQTLSSVRHREISPVVRKLFDDGALGESYTRTLIDVVIDLRQGKKAQAYLYHLKGADLETGYGEDQRRQCAIPPVTDSLDPADELAADATSAPLEVGADGRLRVPKMLLTAAGIDGAKVLAERMRGKLVLSKWAFGASSNAVALELSHPTLLQVPPSLASMFDAKQPIEARVDGSQVVIDGSLAPMD